MVCLLFVSILSAAVGVGLFFSMLGGVYLSVPFFITKFAIFIFAAFAGVVILLVISIMIRFFPLWFELHSL